MGLISYRSPIYANMIARPTIGFGIRMVLISFFATSNAGMLSEIKQKLKQIINIFILCYCCETYIDIKFVFKGSHMCD